MNVLCCCLSFKCKERVILTCSLSLFRAKDASPHTSLSLLFFHSTPPLPLLQQGTDERSKVSPVEEAAFCRSHASASLHTYSHRIHRIPAGGGQIQLGAITGAAQTHTHKYLQMHTLSRAVDESDTQPPLTLFVSFLIIIRVHLAYARNTHFFLNSDIRVTQKH